MHFCFMHRSVHIFISVSRMHYVFKRTRQCIVLYTNHEPVSTINTDCIDRIYVSTVLINVADVPEYDAGGPLR